MAKAPPFAGKPGVPAAPKGPMMAAKGNPFAAAKGAPGSARPAPKAGPAKGAPAFMKKTGRGG